MARRAIALVCLLPCACLAQACDAELAGGSRLESARFVVGFRTEPQTVAVGKHFAVTITVCPKAGVQPPESVSVDAFMPEHRHGMNYKAQVTSASPPGSYHASGLMFHMPGRWEFVFDVRSGDRTDRLTRPIVVQ